MDNTNNTLVEINPENISKALQAFGISPDFLQKGENTPAPIALEPVGSNPFKLDLEKGITNDLGSKIGGENTLEQNREILIKGLGLEGIFTDLQKGIEVVNGFADRIGGIETSIQNLNTKPAAELTKAVEGLISDFSKIKSDLGLALQVPNQPKSIVQTYLEKGIDPSMQENGQKITLSLQNNRAQILALLEAKSGINELEKGKQNQFLLNGLLQYESTRSMSKELIVELNKEGYNITN